FISPDVDSKYPSRWLRQSVEDFVVFPLPIEEPPGVAASKPAPHEKRRCSRGDQPCEHIAAAGVERAQMQAGYSAGHYFGTKQSSFPDHATGGVDDAGDTGVRSSQEIAAVLDRPAQGQRLMLIWRRR